MFNIKRLYEVSEKYIEIMVANKIGVKAIRIIEVEFLFLLFWLF